MPVGESSNGFCQPAFATITSPLVTPSGAVLANSKEIDVIGY
jgi:hypothetical protein